MDELQSLPDCRIYHIEKLLPPGVAATMLEGRQTDAGELALVVRTGQTTWQGASIRGVASLHPDDVAPVIEWCATDREVIAAFGRALKRLGWPGAPTLATHVYGSAS